MRPLTVFALVAGLAVGAGCGSEGTIPGNDAQTLRERLDRVRAAIDAGECSKAEEDIDIAREQVDGLNAPQRLRRNLRQGIDKLDAATNRDCDRTTTEEEPTETTTIETTTVTIPTTTATTTTAPPTTTATTPTVTTTVPTQTVTVPEPPTGGVEPGDEDTGGAGGDEG